MTASVQSPLPISQPAQPGLVRCVARLIVIAASLVLAAETASASCGNYLYRNGKPVVAHQMPDTANAGPSAPAAAIPEDHGNSETPKQPCNGPNCSGAPFHSPTVPVEIRWASESAILPDFLAGSGHSGGEFDRPISERGAAHRPRALFRPPRLTAC